MFKKKIEQKWSEVVLSFISSWLNYIRTSFSEAYTLCLVVLLLFSYDVGVNNSPVEQPHALRLLNMLQHHAVSSIRKGMAQSQRPKQTCKNSILRSFSLTCNAWISNKLSPLICSSVCPLTAKIYICYTAVFNFWILNSHQSFFSIKSHILLTV